MFNTIESVLCLTVPRNGGSIYLPKHLGNTVVEEETTTSKLGWLFFLLLFLKEYHINMQSHLKFFLYKTSWLVKLCSS